MYSNITATQYVDEMEPLLAANRTAYLLGQHTDERKAEALRFFDQHWRQLKSSEACGSKLLGGAGVACVADRADGGRFPWSTYYRDPITNNGF